MFDLRRCLIVCAAGACFVAAPPAEAEPTEPLELGATLCLYPMQLPFSESRAEARRPALQGKLIDALAEASFHVADPAAVKALEERVRKETGGFVDPALGWRDGPRFLAYREQLGTAQRAELGCDAELRASIATLRATFIGGIARWDGTSQQVSSTGRLVMNALAGVQESGWVTAFSLWLQVTDLAGKNVSFRTAGIETPVTFAVVEDQDLVPEDRWLTDDVRFSDAIRSALGPLGEALRLRGGP